MSANNKKVMLTRHTQEDVVFTMYGVNSPSTYLEEIEHISVYGRALYNLFGHFMTIPPMRFHDLDDRAKQLTGLEYEHVRTLAYVEPDVIEATELEKIDGDKYYSALIVYNGPFIGCLGFGEGSDEHEAKTNAHDNLIDVMFEFLELVAKYHPTRDLMKRMAYGLIDEQYIDEELGYCTYPNTDQLYDPVLWICYNNMHDFYMEKDFDENEDTEYLTIKKLMHDIETNPGPVVIPQVGIHITQIELEKHELIFPDGFKVVVQDEDIVIENGQIIFRRLSSELEQYLNKNELGTQYADTKCEAVWRKRTTIWSNHHDYQAFKRCIITTDTSLNKVNHSNEPFKYYTESKGSVYRAKNFLFIPSSLLSVQFSKRWYSGNKLDLRVLTMFMSSVANQDMNKRQIVETVVRIAQLKMMLMNSKDTLLDEYANTFWMLYRVTLANMREKRLGFTDYELNEELRNVQVIIPTTSKRITPHKLNSKNIFTIENVKAMQNLIDNQSILSPRDQTPPEKMNLEELRSYYLDGRAILFGESITRKGFKSDRVFKQISVNQVPIDTDAKKFLYKLVSLRQIKYDITEVFESVVRSMHINNMNEDFQRKILLKLCKTQFASMDYKGLYQIYMKPNKTDEDLRQLALASQNEVYAFGKFFGIEYEFNLFANEEYITLLRGPSNINRDTDDNSGWLSRIKAKMLAPFYKVSDKWADAGDSMNDFAKKANEALERLSEKAFNCGYTRTAYAGSCFDSEDIRSTYQSCKNMVAGFFDDLMAKLCKLFGVDYDRLIHPQDLFLYYLIWKETDNKYMKFFILLDIAIQLGMADIMWNILKKVYYGCKKLLTPKNITKNIEKEKYMATQRINIEKMNKHTLECRSKIPNLDQEKQHVQEETGFVTGIVDLLSNATPTVLGTLAVVTLSYLGYKAVDEKETNVGKKIINIARNMSFLALGMGALPKIYTNFIAVFQYVKDWIMEKTQKDFKSVITLEEEAKKFLRTAIYPSGAAEHLMFTDIGVCIKYFEHYSQALDIQKNLHRFRCPKLAATLSRRIKEITSLNTLAMSAVGMQLKDIELVHVQYYSGPGVGKTDLMMKTVDVAEDIRIEVENVFRKAAGLPLLVKSKLPGQGTYSANDNLNNEDGYYGQTKCVKDEENVMKNPTPADVVDRLSAASGTARIIRKADLNSKGMLRTVYVQSSGTNNAFAKLDGMFCPEALWRRRILVKLAVKPEYLLPNNMVDNQKIIDHKLDRKLGEHLTFTILNPTDESEVPEEPWMLDMSSDDYWDVIQMKIRTHFTTEMTRQYQNPTMAELRMHFQAMIDHIRHQVGKDAPKDVSELIGAMRNEIETKIESWTEEAKAERREQLGLSKDAEVDISEELRMFETAREENLKQLEMLETASSYMSDESSDIYTEMEDLRRVVFDDLGNVAPLAAFEDTDNITQIYSSAYSKLEHELKPDGHLYKMVASNELHKTRDAKIDYSNIVLEKDTESKMTHLAYKSAVPLSTYDQSVVLHHLMRLSILEDETKIQAEIELGIQNTKTMGKVEKIKRKFAQMIAETEQVLSSVGSWVWDQVSTHARNFFHAAVHGLGIIVAFFSFITLLDVLSPRNITYNRQNDKRIMTPSISNISKTLEENTQALAKAVSYKIFLKQGDSSKECMAIGVGGSAFLVNWHSVSFITRPATVIIADNLTVEKDPANCMRTLNVLPQQIKRIVHKDKVYDAAIMVIEGFRPIRVATEHFISDMDIADNFLNFSESLYQTLMLKECQNSHDLGTYNVNRKWDVSAWSPARLSQLALPGVVEHTDQFLFEEHARAKHGDSGSLVYHNNTRIPGKFFGILTAASSHKTYFGCVTQEAIKDTLAKFNPTHTMHVIPLQGDRIENIHKLYKVFDYPEHVYESHLPDQSISTNPGYKLSPISKHFPCDAEPAVQREDDPRVPPGAQHFLKASLNKSVDLNPVTFTPEEEEFYKKCLRAMFYRYMPNIDQVRVYDTVKAITGVKRMGSTSIDTKSSVGLPYKLEKGVSGKKPFIQYNTAENCWHIQQRILTDVQIYERHYLQGFVPYNNKLEFRKRELVSPEKIRRSKTRTVGTGNVIHLIIYNKMYKDFYTMLKNNWIQGRPSPFVMGLNMEQHTDLFISYCVNPNYIMDFDIKGWEQKVTLKHLLMNNEVKAKIITEMYARRGEVCPYDIKTIGAGLAVDFMHTSVAFEKVLFEKWSGLVSGHPGTLAENSEAHHGETFLIIRDILIRAGKQHLATPNQIMDNVSVIVAADDTFISVSESWLPWVNIETMVAGYERRSFELTAADKTKNFAPKNIYTAQFLKHQIRKDEDGRHVHAPKKESVYQLLHWVRTDTELSETQQFLTNVDNAMRMAFFVGREFYEETVQKLNVALLDTRDKLEWPYTYEEMSDKINLKFEVNSDPIHNALHDDTEIDFRF